MLYLARRKGGLWQAGSLGQVREMDYVGKQMQKLGVLPGMETPQCLEQLLARSGWMIKMEYIYE